MISAVMQHFDLSRKENEIALTTNVKYEWKQWHQKVQPKRLKPWMRDAYVTIRAMIKDEQCDQISN